MVMRQMTFFGGGDLGKARPGVGQRNFTGSRNRASSYQPGGTYTKL